MYDNANMGPQRRRGGRVWIPCVRGLESIGSADASTAGGEKEMKENGTRTTNSSVVPTILRGAARERGRERVVSFPDQIQYDCSERGASTSIMLR